MAARIRGEKIWERMEAVCKIASLPDWDRGFMDSICKAYQKWNGLTPKQFSTFEKIERRNSEEAQAERETWAENYTDEMRENVLVMAKYYEHTAYFSELVTRVLMAHASGKDVLLTPKQYRAMTSNKFAVKVLNNHFSEPMFKVGEMAVVRNTQGIPAYMRARTVTILSHPDKGHRPAKGGKAVEVFIHETGMKVRINERDLKNFKG